MLSMPSNCFEVFIFASILRRILRSQLFVAYLLIFIAPNSLDLSHAIVASDSVDSSLSFVFTQEKFDSAELIFASNFRFFFRRSFLACPAASKSSQRLASGAAMAPSDPTDHPKCQAMSCRLHALLCSLRLRLHCGYHTTFHKKRLH